MNKTIILKIPAAATIIINPQGFCINDIPEVFTFIPKALKIIVGMDIKTVIIARTFMTIF
jgi:hypothetical protein